MYLSIDTELSGPGLDLLTASFILANNELSCVDILNLKLCPDNGIYRVKPESIEYNGIDLIKLKKEAILYKDAKTVLYNCLDNWSNSGKIKLIPIGQGIKGDVNIICEQIISKNSWNKFVSYGGIDTSDIAKFLQLKNKLPKDLNISLDDLYKFLCGDAQPIGSTKDIIDAFKNLSVLKALKDL